MARLNANFVLIKKMEQVYGMNYYSKNITIAPKFTAFSSYSIHYVPGQVGILAYVVSGYSFTLIFPTTNPHPIDKVGMTYQQLVICGGDILGLYRYVSIISEEEDLKHSS